MGVENLWDSSVGRRLLSRDLTVLVDSHSQSQFHTDFSFRCGYISSPDFQLSVEKCSKLSSNEFCFNSNSETVCH